MRLSYNINIRKLSILVAFFAIFVIAFMRLNSIFREPLQISENYSVFFVICLFILDIILIIFVWFRIRTIYVNDIKTLKTTNFIDKLYTIIFNTILYAIIPFNNLHIYLSANFIYYGSIINKISLIIKNYNLIDYSFLFILLFSAMPFCIINITCVFEVIHLKQLFITFKLLPLLFLPLLFKIILIVAIDFFEKNISVLRDELHITEVGENVNSVVLSKEFLNDVKHLNQMLLMVERRTDNLALSRFKHLTTREVYFYYLYFDTYKTTLFDINNIFTVYNNFFSVLRLIVVIILITYVIALNIL